MQKTKDLSKHNTQMEANVAEYLKNNPGFFDKYPELIPTIFPQIVEEGGVANFQQHLNQKLQKKIHKLFDSSHKLLTATDENLALLHAINDVVLTLLEVETFEDYLYFLFDGVPAALNVDFLNLCIEDNAAISNNAKVFLRRHGVRFVHKDIFEHFKTPNKDDSMAPLLEEHCKESPQIFGRSSSNVQSHALLYMPWDDLNFSGLLAFGSEHPTTYHPDQATDLLCFLANSIRLTLKPWLKAMIDE
jgi:uncharacterized protein